MSRWWILVHDDGDGVVTGALAYAGLDGDKKIYFTHPVGLLEDLEVVEEGSNVFIGDVALTKAHYKQVLEKLREVSEWGGQVIYIDHHPLPVGFNAKSFPGVLVYDYKTSSSELTRKFFGDKLSLEYDRLALIGAVCDYLEETIWVKERMLEWDKRMIYFEAGILATGLEGSRGLHDFKRTIVKHLASGGLPSDLTGLVIRALMEAVQEEELRRRVYEKATPLDKIAYVIEPGGSLGRSAIYAMTSRGKIVGVAVDRKKDYAVISVRCRSSSIDLNKILSSIAEKYGGVGGGHVSAAGARIPWSNLMKFLLELDQRIAKELERG